MNEKKPYRLIRELWQGRVLLGPGTTVLADQRKAEWLHDQGVIIMPGRKPIAKAQNSASRSAPQRRGGCCGWR